MTLPTPTPMPMPTPSPMPMPMPRPRVHRALLVSLLTVGVSVAAVALSSAPSGAQATSPEDARNVTTLLEAMRGVAPLPCALALNVIEGNGWGNWGGGDGMGRDSTSEAMRRWLNEGLHDPSVVPTLRSAMDPGDACVRQTAARLLGRVEHPRAVAALAEALRSGDVTTRTLGAFGLGLTDAPAAYDPLVGALRDPEAEVRATAAIGLGRLEDHRASAVLVPLLSGDRSPAVRRAAAVALGMLE